MEQDSKTPYTIIVNGVTYGQKSNMESERSEWQGDY